MLRTALGLSLVTGKPFRIFNIRAGRRKPGLLRQHLTAVEAAVRVGAAHVAGAEPNSTNLTFEPSGIRHGAYEFSIGTAGSTTLVLQTILPALLVAEGPSTITLNGGTHNPMAPPFEFLADSFAPLVSRMGPSVDVRLNRYGFAPAGGGQIVAHIQPRALTPLHIGRAAELRTPMAEAIVAHIPISIAEREVRIARRRLSWPPDSFRVDSTKDSDGPGNVFTLKFTTADVTTVVTGFGEFGVRAEALAHQACESVRRMRTSGASVCRHLADQILLPMAMVGEGSYYSEPLSTHATTNMETIRQFLKVEFRVDEVADRLVRVSVRELRGQDQARPFVT